MASSKHAPLPQASLPWVDGQGRPTQAFYNFMVALAANNTGPYVSAANDTAAAAAGVPLNGVYDDGHLRPRKT
jgi:hypothetical protein